MTTQPSDRILLVVPSYRRLYDRIERLRELSPIPTKYLVSVLETSLKSWRLSTALGRKVQLYLQYVFRKNVWIGERARVARDAELPALTEQPIFTSILSQHLSIMFHHSLLLSIHRLCHATKRSYSNVQDEVKGARSRAYGQTISTKDQWTRRIPKNKFWPRKLFNHVYSKRKEVIILVTFGLQRCRTGEMSAFKSNPMTRGSITSGRSLNITKLDGWMSPKNITSRLSSTV